MADLVIATGNAGKLSEYRELLADTGLNLIAFDPDVEETGSTYEENARLKAEAAFRLTGLPALGDDAGLEVEVLGGAPGIRSARLAPTQKERTAKLLELLEAFPRPWLARFICVIALARPGQETVVVRGERAGQVVSDWSGEAGFGYDPIFFVPDAGSTFGAMTSTEKHTWSHRGAAVNRLLGSGALTVLTDAGVL